VKFAPAAATVLLALVLTGCAGAAPRDDAATTTPAADGTCEADQVRLVVEFGALGADEVDTCAPPGPAVDALASAGITTEGTADYGDQVVCRVDELPAPDVESCTTLPSDAYWALWVKGAPDDEWGYAEEGVATLELAAGQSLGLVYTQGTDSIPPSD
jgi:hypothetical protein